MNSTKPLVDVIFVEHWPAHKPSSDAIKELMAIVEEETNGEWTDEDAKQWLESGKLTLAVAGRIIEGQSGFEPLALCGLVIREYKDGNRWGDIPFIAGRDMNDWLHLLPKIKEWMRSRGAEKARIRGRQGWPRLLKQEKLTLRYTVFDLELEE